ncbi:MAG: hypothetical protein FJ035_01300 [Chloroflexi bacterium]|nr:hypothetical protein [Chloroflexota bacterium]
MELELWFIGPPIHWDAASDGEQRHFTNFLTWSDTALVGADRAIRQRSDHCLIDQWQALTRHDIRQAIGRLRDVALKERRDVAPWTPLFRGDRSSVAFTQKLDGFEIEIPAYGTAEDYLGWILGEAVPLVVEAIEHGARGPTSLDPDLPVEEQMPFSRSNPWSAHLDPELRRLIES